MAEAVEIHEELDVEQEIAGKGVKVRESERGPFAIWENPEMGQAYALDQAQAEQVADGFEFSALAEKFGEVPAREKVVEMLKSIGPGVATTLLFSQTGANGMMLAHVWFGANFPLFRHSHPRFGDCLYYVIAGEILVGKRRLGSGSGFFVPNGMPYNGMPYRRRAVHRGAGRRGTARVPRGRRRCRGAGHEVRRTLPRRDPAAHRPGERSPAGLGAAREDRGYGATAGGAGLRVGATPGATWSPVSGPCVNSSRDGTSPSPTVARVGAVREFESGRHKGVPYTSAS